VPKYDRTTLRAVAQAHGQRHYSDVATRLGIAPVTAWRLWNGKTAPSPDVAARVEATYGLPVSRLLMPAEHQCEAV
jgi:transcriptional regulator with XRE-family HTH domain